MTKNTIRGAMMRKFIVLFIIILALMLSACGSILYNNTPQNTATFTPQNNNPTIVTALPAIDTAADSDSQSLPDYINTDYLIASQDEVDVYFVDAYIDANNDESYEILIHNKSDQTLFVNCVDIAINGRSLLPYISAKANANSYYLYVDSLPSEHGSFLSDEGKAATIQVDMYFTNYSDNSEYTHIDQKLVIDESIEIAPAEFAGQIIYDENDFIIGLEKIADLDGINSFVIYYENNTDTSLVVLIERIMIGANEISHQTPLSITHHSYVYWPVELDESIPNAEYKSSIDYAIVENISASVEGLEGERLTFTLK